MCRIKTGSNTAQENGRGTLSAAPVPIRVRSTPGNYSAVARRRVARRPSAPRNTAPKARTTPAPGSGAGAGTTLLLEPCPCPPATPIRAAAPTSPGRKPSPAPTARQHLCDVADTGDRTSIRKLVTRQAGRLRKGLLTRDRRWTPQTVCSGTAVGSVTSAASLIRRVTGFFACRTGRAATNGLPHSSLSTGCPVLASAKTGVPARQALRDEVLAPRGADARHTVAARLARRQRRLHQVLPHIRRHRRRAHPEVASKTRTAPPRPAPPPPTGPAPSRRGSSGKRPEGPEGKGPRGRQRPLRTRTHSGRRS